MACADKTLCEQNITFEILLSTQNLLSVCLVCRGEAGCSEPGLAPGDVVLVMQQKEHEQFKRVGIDLIIVKKISLKEALCGAILHIKHLDGRVLKITTPSGGWDRYGSVG
jgi:DnaJ family protein A protein 2